MPDVRRVTLLRTDLLPWESAPVSEGGRWPFCDGCFHQVQRTKRPVDDRCVNPNMASNGGPGVVVTVQRETGFACGGLHGCVPSWLVVASCYGRLEDDRAEGENERGTR